jgi:hypothetical protein
MTANPPATTGVTFNLRVGNADRVGVAIGLPRERLREGSAVRRVHSVPTGPGGEATVTRNAPLTVRQLVPTRPAPLDITALAIACLGPVGPADPNSAAFLTFHVAPDGSITAATSNRPTDDTIDHLRRAACDSEIYTDSGTASPSPSPSPT